MMEQKTAEWFEARLGKVTASKIADVMAKTKTGVSITRENYLHQLIAERVTGTVGESFSNAAMQWGNEQEPFARAAYEMHTGFEVVEVGFIPHPTIADSGASPDGLISDSGLIEIKCPNTATMISQIISGTIPRKYILQMQWQMACTDRSWCDYAVFDPRMPDSKQLYIQRVNRDDFLIAEIETEVKAFLEEVAAAVKTLTIFEEPNVKS